MEELPFRIAKNNADRKQTGREAYSNRGKFLVRIFNSFRFDYLCAPSTVQKLVNIEICCVVRDDVFLFGITYRGIFLLEDYFEYHGDFRRVEKMVLSWQEFETRSTCSRSEGIAVINIVAAHFYVLLSSLIINSKPRARA